MGLLDLFDPTSDKSRYNKYKKIVSELKAKKETYDGQFKYLGTIANDVFVAFDGKGDDSAGEMVDILNDAVYLGKRYYMELLSEMNSAKIQLGKKITEAEQLMNYYKEKYEAKDI